MRKIFLVVSIILCLIMLSSCKDQDLIIINKSSQRLYDVKLIYNDSLYIDNHGDILSGEKVNFKFPESLAEMDISISYKNEDGKEFKKMVVGYVEHGYPTIKIIIYENNGELIFDTKQY